VIDLTILHEFEHSNYIFMWNLINTPITLDVAFLSPLITFYFSPCAPAAP